MLQGDISSNCFQHDVVLDKAVIIYPTVLSSAIAATQKEIEFFLEPFVPIGNSYFNTFAVKKFKILKNAERKLADSIME